MKGRDILIGAALGLCLVVISHGQHAQVSTNPSPVASAPSPAATSAPPASVPATPLPESSPAVPSPQAGPGNVSTGPGPVPSGAPGWLILAAFIAALALSVSTVAVTAFNIRTANRRQ